MYIYIYIYIFMLLYVLCFLPIVCILQTKHELPKVTRISSHPLYTAIPTHRYPDTHPLPMSPSTPPPITQSLPWTHCLSPYAQSLCRT